MSNTTNFYTKDASNNLVDIITLYDRSAPGTQTTNFITNGTGYTNTNKDLGQIFTPYIYGANSINFFNFSSGATTDLGSKFAQIGKASKYTATGTYVVSSNSTYNTIIKFTSSGTIKFNSSAITARTLLVGGGGSGGIGQITTLSAGCWHSGGGGGGGGVGIGNISFNQSTSYTITVGAGGANSSISGTNVSETAYSGGNGISFSKTPDVVISGKYGYGSVILPTSGGSGGGGGLSGIYAELPGPAGAYQSYNLSKNNGATSTPGSGTFLTYYGNSGGSAPVLTTEYCGAAGGGGAGSVGGDSVYSYTNTQTNQYWYYEGSGGSGILFDVTNSYYGGGGGAGCGGAALTYKPYNGYGGSGGGGNGATAANGSGSATLAGATINGSNGTPNTGGGGGGAGFDLVTSMGGGMAITSTYTCVGGIGGSGVCIIAFNI